MNNDLLEAGPFVDTIFKMKRIMEMKIAWDYRNNLSRNK